MSNFLTKTPSPAERQRWTTFYQQQLENRLHWAVELVGQHKELATPLRDHFGTLLMLLSRARSQPYLHSLSIELIGLLHPWPLRWEYWSEWEAQIRFAAQTAALLEQPVQQSEFLSYLAEHLRLTGRLKEAITEGKRALKVARKWQALVPMARAGQVVIYILHMLGEVTEAKHLLYELAQECDLTNSPSAEHSMALAYLALEQMEFLRKKGQLNQAIARADEILAQLSGWSEVDELIRIAVYHRRAIACWVRGKYPEAIRDLLQVIAYYNQIGDNFAEMDMYHDLGLVYWRMGRLKEAQAIWQRCIATAEQLNASYLLTHSVGAMAVIYLSNGELEQGLSYVERHLTLATRIGFASHRTVALINRALFRLYLGEYLMALPDLEEGHKFILAQGSQLELTANLVHRSYCYMRLGQLEQGLEFAERAYDLVQKLEMATLQIMTRRCLACYRPAPENRKLLEEALDLARTHHCRLEEAACLLSLAPLACDESEKMDFWQAGKKILEEIEATAWLKGCSPDNPPFIVLIW